MLRRQNSPSPVSNFFTGTKLLPKKNTATPAATKPKTSGMEFGGSAVVPMTCVVVTLKSAVTGSAVGSRKSMLDAAL